MPTQFSESLSWLSWDCARSLKTWSRSEGNIRLSEDDGPSSQEFLDDDDDEDARVLDLSDSASIFDAATEAQQAFADSPPRKPTKPPGTGAS
ncbi:hypothetical protein ONZ45_g16055 [Pleurotus djamor]|nr:hypothetical protein ONZ45_g16055 [Pleurotus djamor]